MNVCKHTAKCAWCFVNIITWVYCSIIISSLVYACVCVCVCVAGQMALNGSSTCDLVVPLQLEVCVSPPLPAVHSTAREQNTNVLSLQTRSMSVVGVKKKKKMFFFLFLWRFTQVMVNLSSSKRNISPGICPHSGKNSAAGFSFLAGWCAITAHCRLCLCSFVWNVPIRLFESKPDKVFL